MNVRERVEAMADYCDVEVALVVVGGKWKLLILKHLLAGTQRFGQLKRTMPNITPRMLTRQLRELEEHGVVQRTVYAEVPPRTEYCLTELGASLHDLVCHLDDWGKKYREQLRNQDITVLPTSSE